MACTLCPPGSGPREACTRSEDAVCEACPPGRFSPGGKAPCRPCSACREGNQTRVADCTLSRDTACFPCPRGFFFDNATLQCRKCGSCLPGRVQRAEDIAGVEAALHAQPEQVELRVVGDEGGA
ncbi:MAG: hypothetical protein DSY55_03365, partial [Clostridia bacterium]